LHIFLQFEAPWFFRCELKAVWRRPDEKRKSNVGRKPVNFKFY